MKEHALNLTDLTLDQQIKANGGNPVIVFIAGAIVGGMIYDAYKAACKAVIKAQVEHPEWYDGPVHSQR